MAGGAREEMKGDSEFLQRRPHRLDARHKMPRFESQVSATDEASTVEAGSTDEPTVDLTLLLLALEAALEAVDEPICDGDTVECPTMSFIRPPQRLRCVFAEAQPKTRPNNSAGAERDALMAQSSPCISRERARVGVVVAARVWVVSGSERAGVPLYNRSTAVICSPFVRREIATRAPRAHSVSSGVRF